MKKIKLLILSTLASTSINTYAQCIEGGIKDTSNNPVIYANVILLNASDSTFFKGSVSDDQGMFRIDGVQKGNYILKLSYLGYKEYTQRFSVLGDDMNIGFITLNEDTKVLSEVTVTANRIRVYSKGGNIVTDIANSSLKNVGNAKEVMKHIPGIIATGDKYEVFGKGSPVIYINNKKMRNDNELLMLKSTDILNVEVISNPGAGYDADTRAVVKITTRKKRRNGFMAQMDAEAVQSNHFYHNEGVSLSYQWNKLNIFGSYRFDRTKEDIKYDVTQTNYEKMQNMMKFHHPNILTAVMTIPILPE